MPTDKTDPLLRCDNCGREAPVPTVPPHGEHSETALFYVSDAAGDAGEPEYSCLACREVATRARA